MSIKPILFNTDEVKAILDGRKTVTRKIVKCKYSNTHLEIFNNKYGSRLIELQNDIEGETYGKNENGVTWHNPLACREVEREYAPYKIGDILWVRETFCDCIPYFGYLPDIQRYVYKTNETQASMESRKSYGIVWTPSIHMPKAAARIFLRVNDVKVERLQDITNEQARNEGISYPEGLNNWVSSFHISWDSTVKNDSEKWSANPWVWVISFERCEKPEGWCK